MLMGRNEFSGRAVVPLTDLTSSGTPLKTAELVSVRIGEPPTTTEVHAVPSSTLPDSGYRKVSPDGDPSVVIPPYRSEAPTSLLDRLTEFFLPRGLSPKTLLARFASHPGQEGSPPGAHDLTLAVDRLEKSQQFATGMTLMSSLTQSVMASSKRLTQGQ
jgi:hypothetical protein